MEHTEGLGSWLALVEMVFPVTEDDRGLDGEPNDRRAAERLHAVLAPLLRPESPIGSYAIRVQRIGGIPALARRVAGKKGEADEITCP